MFVKSLPMIISCLAIIYALVRLYRSKITVENAKITEMSALIKNALRTYLKVQYKWLAAFFGVLVVVFIIMSFGFNVLNKWVPISFLTGAFFSALAGWIASSVAMVAIPRVAQAATKNLRLPFRIASSAGLIAGIFVVSLGIIDINAWYLILSNFIEDGPEKLRLVTNTLLTFGFGASTYAIAARAGGGIFTKVADFAADVFGKIFKDLPEDSPENPLVIVDAAGDQAGDNTGGTADGYESFTATILAIMALGAAAFNQENFILVALLIAAAGLVFSIIGGSLFMKTKEGANQKTLIASLNKGSFSSMILTSIASFIILFLMDIPNAFGLGLSIITGQLVGIVTSKSTEWFTSTGFKPTRDVANTADKGAAAIITSGFGNGMISPFIPTIAIIIGSVVAFMFATQGDTSNEAISLGVYGISLGALGLLSNMPMILAIDIFGPISDNAGSIANYAELGDKVRERTDDLDAAGNTTAAMTKSSFAAATIYSSLALLFAFGEEIRHAMLHLGIDQFKLYDRTISVVEATFPELVTHFNGNIASILFISGALLGIAGALMFGGILIKSVAHGANKLIEEARLQYNEKQENGTPFDYNKNIVIATKAAQTGLAKGLIFIVLLPAFTGIFLGVSGLLGMLLGSIISGFVLGLLFSNTGGIYDNAKKYIEAKSGVEKRIKDAAVEADTFGDPLKDTIGPAFNVYIKYMIMTAIILVTLIISSSLF